MPEQLLPLYGISQENAVIQPYGAGLINHTWRISTDSRTYILQRVNQAVFKHPEAIDKNLRMLKAHVAETYPGYLFVAPLPALSGETLVVHDGDHYRLFPFIDGTHAINVAGKPDEAFEAARQFARFSRLFSDFDAKRLNATLPDFHNLNLRYRQFLKACKTAGPERMSKALNSIEFARKNEHIVDVFNDIVANSRIPLRVVHHDTKINNVLFDKYNKAICVIDLDTVMPGYFISDVGDMMRTYLSPAGEEEQDTTQVQVRPDYFKAIYEGYIEEMGDIMTHIERSSFIYAGRFLIFMQALRFLTDYLQNDVYYGARYEDHNLRRAENQFTLLKRYVEHEAEFRHIAP
ncbi:aminoglycoside phosphotransferase family protein [Pedobacter sp. JY14-1]|uniref:phosphotransferase enzyme family protein n=1 Tax=Pedobacter sp. JY14-1 TaxID=3034151 RepID=UPI0023E1183E|nr:aminoglycoside phosphotransferase family protein [Pedobacter sp. JY14-1]